MCGAGNHQSKKCKKKKRGHKDDATFSNKLGGSTVYCKNCKWNGGTESGKNIKIKKHLNSLLLVPPNKQNLVVAKGDSVVFPNLLAKRRQNHSFECKKCLGITVILLDGDVLKTMQQDQIPISK